jgi:hypothetical protein
MAKQPFANQTPFHGLPLVTDAIARHACRFRCAHHRLLPCQTQRQADAKLYPARAALDSYGWQSHSQGFFPRIHLRVITSSPITGEPPLALNPLHVDGDANAEFDMKQRPDRRPCKLTMTPVQPARRQALLGVLVCKVDCSFRRQLRDDGLDHVNMLGLFISQFLE